MEATTVLRKPLLTEKNTDATDQGRYTFEVDKRARKDQIRRAVEEIYGVHVVSVATMRRKGKVRRTKWGYTKTRDIKKAIVKIREGERIEFF